MWGPARQTTVQSRAPGGRTGAAWGGWGACRGVVWGCGLLPSLSLRGCGEEDAGELRPESLGMGAGALAAGYPRLGWPGCPGVPWGRRLSTSAGCETTTCVSVTEVLRVLPQEITRRGDCGPGQPRGMTMKRKWGARMSLAVGTFPRPGGGRCPRLFPSSRGRGAVVGGGVATSQRVSVPGAVGTNPRWGRVRGARSPPPPLHNSPPGAGWPLAPGVVQGGAQGSAGPLRSPGGPHCPYNATRGGADSYRTRGPRRPSLGGGQGGDRGGVRGSRQVDGGWRGLVPRTGGPHHPPVGRRSCRGSGSPTQGPSPPPRAVSVWGRGGKGHSRP